MSDWDHWLKEQPPTAAEMEEVMTDMALTWQLGGTYFAENKRAYFLYVLTIMENSGAKRFGGMSFVSTGTGRKAILDKYRTPDGRVIEVGYLL